ncbi:hypothetical protein [Paracoccus sp. (in: a-proteobacteria)]|uniref:hypothetical protein n=1 Tax=Paracoccus sp. TaxID=267 RepID=UPI00396CF407
MAYANKIAEALDGATETEKAELARFLTSSFDTTEQLDNDARVREYVAAFDRFVASKQGE